MPANVNLCETIAAPHDHLRALVADVVGNGRNEGVDRREHAAPHEIDGGVRAHDGAVQDDG